MAADEKKSFVLYADLLNLVSQLPDETAGKLFKVILQYVNDVEVCIEDLLLKVAFEPIRAQLERDFAKWDKIKIRRSESGKLGGRPKKEEIQTEPETEAEKAKKANAFSEKQSKAKKAVTVNDTVTVTDTVTVINKEREKKNFSPPSLLEVQEFIIEKKYGVNAHSFWNFYESKNWMVGKNKMKDWKKAVAGWDSREKENLKNKDQNGKSNNTSGTKQAYEFSVDRIIETYTGDSE
ncbi:MAG TPA: DUF6291 domain-containing protein [Flavobacterium sp.]|jgi:hypothetical protein